MECLLNWREAIEDFRVGLKNSYPLCCVLRYCLDSLLYRYPTSAINRGTVDVLGSTHVPCDIFHRGEPFPAKLDYIDKFHVYHLKANT